MKHLLSSLTLILCLLWSTSSLAGNAGTTFNLSGAGSKSDTRVFAGLQWTQDSGPTPALVLGLTRTKTDSSGDTQGARLSVSVKLTGNSGLDKLKLNLLKGKEKLQGELGGGYDFMNGKPFFSIGANAPFVGFGLDIDLQGELSPSLLLHTQGKFEKPKQRCVPVAGAGGQFTDANCLIPNNLNNLGPA